MKNVIFFLLISLCCFACNETKPSKTQKETAVKEEVIPAKKPLVIESTPFEVKTANFEFDDNTGVPSADLYIHSEMAKDSIFLAKDYGAMPVKTADQRAGFNIPVDAAFAINAYYAGGGNVYYGVAKENILTVYRRFLEEPHPDNEDIEPEQFEIFKTFAFYDDGIVEQ